MFWLSVYMKPAFASAFATYVFFNSTKKTSYSNTAMCTWNYLKTATENEKWNIFPVFNEALLLLFCVSTQLQITNVP